MNNTTTLKKALPLFVLMFFSAQLFAGEVLEKKITYSAKNQPLKKVLADIGQRFGVAFSYSENVVQASKSVSISVKEKPLTQVLDKLLDNNVTYREISGQVVIMKKKTAASGYTISGFVKEKGSGELLLGVNIYLPGTSTGTTSNTYGFYSITLPKGQVRLAFSYVGYGTVYIDTLLNKDINIDVELDPVLETGEVVIEATTGDQPSKVTQMSKIDIPVQQVKDIPALLGEKDVLKVIQLMPGVQKGSEGQSGFYVRGGGPDQNLIILDDAVVYNAFHLFGFFSLFNGDALKSIELTKGGFPARYGGRLSSVLNMTMKEGNKEKVTGEAGIGLISSRLTLEGPLKKNKSSFLISGRRTYIDVLLMPFMPDNLKAGYYFYDLNAKVNYDIDKKNKVYLSGYFGKDKFYGVTKEINYKSDFSLGWGNATATARWNHVFSNKLFANTSAIFTNYRFVISAKEEDLSTKDVFNLRFFSQIRDYSLKYDLDYIPNTNHYIKMGAIVTHHTFSPSAVTYKNTFDNENFTHKRNINCIESALYIEDDYRPAPRWKINGGFRLSHFYNRGRNYINPEPRLAVAYQLKPDLALKASAAVMNQYMHLLSNTGIGLPTDLWVPSTSNVSPQRSIQTALGFAKDIPKHNLSLTVEGYYKKMDHIIGYKEGATFLVFDDPLSTSNYTWENNITSGQGWSYGAEFLLQRKKGKLNGWIGYTLSWTQLQFDAVNFGKKYRAKYDRRHDISVVGIYNINSHITLSATWVYGTGQATTLPQAYYNATIFDPTRPLSGSYITGASDYGQKNSFRMAPYHRMDIGIRSTRKVTLFNMPFERTFEFSIYNVYNRHNPFFYYSTTDNNGKAVLKQVSLFPILPTLSWTFKF